MKSLELYPELSAALREACAAMGGHALAALLDEARDSRLVLDGRGLEIIRDYVRRIERHLDERYPGHDEEDENYDPAAEDEYLDAMESYRNKLVMLVADQVGDTFLEDPS
jgi:hypothetical protein